MGFVKSKIWYFMNLVYFELMRYFLITQLLLLLNCTCSYTQNRYGKNITEKQASSYLWLETTQIWVGTYNDIDYLIDRGAEIDYINPYEKPKSTPFLNASGMLENLQEQKHYSQEEIEAYEIEAVKIVKYLASKGANIHATSTSRKLNALHLAACGGREKVIPVLVDLGLDINEADAEGGTPLIHAIGAGDLATVRAIVECGADINICTPDGNSPLDWAMAYARAKDHLWDIKYHDQEAISEYLQSLDAKHGKNSFKGYLYFDESKE